MKQILILIILFSFLGCRTKQKASFYKTEGRTDIERIKFDSLRETVKKNETKKVTDNSVQQQKSEFEGDIIIKGKSDSLNPLEFHNVVGSDTLQSITIRGNADYVINNHFKNSKEDTKESRKENSTNVIQQTARDLVSKETIKEVAAVVTEKTREIKAKGFQFGVWITVILWGLGIIAVLGLILWIRKANPFSRLINKIKNSL